MAMPANRATDDTIFPWIERLLQNHPTSAVFEELAARFKREKEYRGLFDARLMQKRSELGLPLVSSARIGDMPNELQQAYQDGYIQAAREVGDLILADGNIPQAWPYFRAIGDTGPIVRALESFDASDPDTPESREALGSTIQIAFQEGLHPRKGFELILQHHGLCRAITLFGAHPQGDARLESLRLLVRSLHGELVTNLRRAISHAEGTAAESDSIAALIEGRDWLFDNNAQYTDSSHIAPVLELSAELEDKETLGLAVEIADYATRLDAMFQFADYPPFERAYHDRCIYLKALLGKDIDRAVQHFDEKAAAADANQVGYRPAEVLVKLLIRLGRYDDAISRFRRYLMDASQEELSCPTLAQLCQMAGDYTQLKQVAKEQSDPLSYMAALIQEATVRREV